MNQFGLTDFFSTATVDSNIIKLFTGGFSSLSIGSGVYTNQALQQAAPVTTALVASNVNDFNKKLSGIGVSNPAEALRVAAQDAFVEFLSLFKNNGISWFYNKPSTQGAREWVDVDAWSTQLGTSVTGKNARNNDVITRGTVLMKFKGTTYMGYFKTLSWEMSAEHPYQWTFTFTFQVERTLGYIYSPAG